MTHQIVLNDKPEKYKSSDLRTNFTRTSSPLGSLTLVGTGDPLQRSDIIVVLPH